MIFGLRCDSMRILKKVSRLIGFEKLLKDENDSFWHRTNFILVQESSLQQHYVTYSMVNISFKIYSNMLYLLNIFFSFFYSFLSYNRHIRVNILMFLHFKKSILCNTKIDTSFGVSCKVA